MSDTSSTAVSSDAPDPRDASIFGPVNITRIIIFATAAICGVVFYYASHWTHWPSQLRFRGSMAQPPLAIGGFIVAIVLLVACTLVGTFVAGRRWFMGGLLAATLGLGAWAARGGTMIFVLFHANDSGANQNVFIPLLVELIAFFGVIGALWNLIWTAAANSARELSVTPEARAKQAAKAGFLTGMLMGSPAHAAMFLKEGAVQDGRGEEGRSTPAALLAQTAIMIIILLILVVTPMKKQVLTSVFVAGLASTALAEYFFADRKAGRWYWLAPLVIGAVGYVAGYISPAGLEMGNLHGTLAPLARILPLDYASMGIAGVLVGYWWMEPEAPAADEEKKADATPNK